MTRSVANGGERDEGDGRERDEGDGCDGGERDEGVEKEPAEADRPNVLFVHVDQHRYDCVGANGHPLVETPTLDRLAREGTNFEHAYTPIPICSPERASLMTGTWPCRHGTINLTGQPGGRPLDPDLATFSEVLSAAGYATRYVGRWHLGHEAEGGPEQFGFDRWVANDRYAEWRADCGLPERPGPDRERGWRGCVDEGVAPDESRVGWAADRVIEELDDLAAADEPFFLRWDTFEPHLPNVVPEPYASMYDPGDIEPWGSFDDDLTDKPWIQAQQRRTWRLEDWSWDEWAPIVARYLGEITLLDAQFGRILDRLDDLGLAEDTLVVYTADHGDMCGGHGMIDKHYVMYDDVVRVPLIARGPGIPAGETCESFVVHALDLARTFVECARAKVPDSFQGESLFRAIDGDGRDAAYATYYGCQMGLFTQRMVRTERWKYVWNATAPDELYDLETDPHELENRATDPACADVVSRVRERLADRLLETGDQLANPWVLGQLREDGWIW